MKTLIALAALATAGAANAVVTFTSQPFDVARPGETIVLDFEAANLPAGFSISGNDFIFQTGSNGQGAAPAGDDTRYLSVLGGGNATIDFPVALGSFSLYIGSIDSYNSLTFTGTLGGNPFAQTLTGGDLTAVPNGDQDAGSTNRTYFFNFNGAQISSITLSSSSNSFEVDNLATSVVPEPATWAMMILGFGMVGASLRRRTMARVAA